MINNLSISKDSVSLCHKDNCLNVKGDIAKVLTYSIALIFIVRGVASLVEASK